MLLNLDQVLEITKAKKPTLYLWMKDHPRLVVKAKESLRGHAFPAPAERVNQGRTRPAPMWDSKDVYMWLADNADHLGRHTKTPTVEATARDYEHSKQPENREEDDPEPTDVEYGLEPVCGEEWVRLTFASMEDAVHWKLKFFGSAPDPEDDTQESKAD